MLYCSAGCAAFDGLRRWTASGSIEKALEAMAKKVQLPHWGSKGAINRAGDALRSDAGLAAGQGTVLESWRMAHRDVIHTFEAMLRARAKKNEDIKIAQRLKRRMTIIDNLSRYANMQLARMDDVAGCRLIFPNVEALHEFRNKVHRARFRHVLKSDKGKYDYIETPTERGYRGIHDIYEYRARKGRPKRCEGLLIEIQYRTSVQHAWATAVEVVTRLTENEPKFDRGDRRHIRFFCLASEILSRAHEGMACGLKEISDQELVDELKVLDKDIRVMRMLLDLVIQKWMGDRLESDHVILHTSKTTKKFEMLQFDLELEASTKLLELEKAFPDDDIVLVGARSIEEVTSAFRNYFNDVGDFLRLTFDAVEKLSPDRKKMEA
jgi:putative GTP pyrophosphokinase